MVKNVNLNDRDGGNAGDNDGCFPIILVPVVAALLLLGGSVWSGRRK